ncbi:MAG: hypothetical protein KF745_07110 [Phycisphaeraceae bacterium]|nr:hypothetical protein [Phycisphaeraceae bacterium]
MTRRRHHSRRAFALPLVMLLALLCGITAAILLELQSSARLAVDNQVRVYRRHHTSLGIRELVADWIRSTAGDIPKSLDDDGRAFDLEAGSANYTVYLTDAQGTALRDPTARGGSGGNIVREVARLLTDADSGGEPLFRTAGPPAISVNSAPRQVLEAVATAAGAPRRAVPFANEIMQKRVDRRLVATDLADAARDAGLTNEQTGRILSMLTVTPELYRIEVRATRRGSSTEQSLQGGLVQFPPTSSSPGASSVVIISWEDLPQDGR